MGNRKIVTFPSHGLNIALTSLMYQITDYIKYHFPHNFFKFTYVNTKNGLKNKYKTQSGLEEMTKPDRPKIISVYDIPNGFQTSDTASGQAPLYFYMGQYTDVSFKNYIPIYNDKYGISLFTSDVPIKINCAFSIETETKSDQMTMVSLLYNNLRFHYGNRLHGLRAHFQVSNMLVDMLGKALYSAPEIDGDSDKFDKFLIKNSRLTEEGYGGFRPLFFNKEKNKKYYYMERIYENTYFQLTEEPQMSEGEQKGKLFEKYTVRFSGFFETFIPLSYLLVIPEIVNGVSFNDLLVVSNDPIVDRFYQVKEINTNFKSTGRLQSKYEPEEVYDTIFVEGDIKSTNPVETFNLFEWLAGTKEKSEKLNALIFYIRDKKYGEVFNTEDKKFLFQMYEHNYIVDPDEYLTVDDDYNVELKNCFNHMDYTIVIKVDKLKMKYLLKDYKKFIEENT